jgi:hypothetical protein
MGEASLSNPSARPRQSTEEMHRDGHYSGASLTRQRPLARILSTKRGDVPGWVLSTLMTTGLSTIIPMEK